MSIKKTTYSLPEARLRAKRFMAYLQRHIMSLVPIETPGVPGGFSVDSHGRLYYDPAALTTDRLDFCASKILLESTALILKHYKRAKKVLGPAPTPEEQITWAIASRLSCWYMLNEVKFKDSRGNQQDFPFPPGTLEPTMFGLSKVDNLSIEEIYSHLGAGKGSKNLKFSKIDIPMAGSAADGVPKPWEKSPPTKGKKGEVDEQGKPLPPALGEFEQDMLNRGIARSIDEEKSRGNIPGAWKRFANEILDPQVDPLERLRACVKFAVNSVNGFGNHSWKKLNRRQPPGAFRLPAHIQPKPDVCCIVDTSGSMNSEDLGLALGVISKILKNHAKSLRVITGDTRMATCQKVFGVNQVDMEGGGGTDIGRIIDEVSASERCDVILAITDGITPYPAAPVPQRVVVCLTQADHRYPIPDWIEVVELKPARKED